jgi:hypothetical protein
VVEDVATRTGGVPLFVEEVTRLLLERGGQEGGIHAVPPTLQQSLTARAARMAASFRVSAMAVPSPHGRLARLLIGLDRLFRLADHCSPASNWDPIMDLGDWLRSLGLERYEAAFRAKPMSCTT